MIKYIMMLIPHFVTDRVALYYAEDNMLQVLCREDEIHCDIEDMVVCKGTIRTWTWFNICAGGRVVIDQ